MHKGREMLSKGIEMVCSHKVLLNLHMHVLGYLVHSFIFYSGSSSPPLLTSAPDTARILCQSFTPKRHRRLRMKDLPKVPMWRLERDSNPRPFG